MTIPPEQQIEALEKRVKELEAENAVMREALAAIISSTPRAREAWLVKNDEAKKGYEALFRMNFGEGFTGTMAYMLWMNKEVAENALLKVVK